MLITLREGFRTALRSSLSSSCLRLRAVLVLVLLSFASLAHALSTHSPRATLATSLQPYASSAPLIPTPSGLLFVSTLDGDLHALDIRTGGHRWSFGTGESLLRSTPATGVDRVEGAVQDGGDWDPLAPVDDVDDGDGGEGGGGGGAAEDNVIIPGVNGQLFFSTRQGQLERLPVTVNELVAASPFRSSDDRMYVGRKQSAFLLLDRRTGSVRRVLSEDGEQLSMEGGQGFYTAQPDDDQHEDEDDDEEQLIWIGRQELSVHAFHGRHGKRWNVSLSEYFAHVDGSAVEKLWSEEQLQAVGMPHLAATVDGQLYAIKNVADRERYQWSYAFTSPISSVHFSRDPTPAGQPVSPQSRIDSMVSARDLIKLPVYYLPPASRTDGAGELSPVSQYLYVRMKAAKTKAIDTYVGQTKEGVLYALPNPPSTSDTSGLPLERDPLIPYLPPSEDTKGAVVPSTGGNGCGVRHPFYPHCMIGLHSISDAQGSSGVYLGLPGLPVPAVVNVSMHGGRESELPHYADADDARRGETGSWWTSVVTSAAVSACMMAPLLLGMWYTQHKANASRRKKKKRINAQQPANPKDADSLASPSPLSPSPPSHSSDPQSSDELVPRERRAQPKADDEKKEFAADPTPASAASQLVLPSPPLRHPSSSSSSMSRQHSSPSPTNSDGSLAIPSTLSSVLSSMSHTYSVGKIQIFADQVLGTGSMGTVVYAGLHETRECAVKRLVKPFFGHDNADKEISLLIQSDQHPNVLRYYAKEEDASFIYIALEKCAGSIQDLIERPADYPHAQHLTILLDMMTGLAHLHGLNIVHRDLKPANILLTSAHHCKLADMGLGKQLDLMRSSFDSVVSGSFGWQPAEVLAGEGRRLTKAVDVFSAGCVVYYVMSAGHHPFGANVEREVNIVRAQADYGHLREHRVEAQDLIASMVTHVADERLSASDCVHHPLFWSDEMKLHFLIDVSDRVEAEPEYSECRLTLERRAAHIVGPAGWEGALDRGLLDNLGKFRKYDFTSLRDLLRVIRNKRHHYRDLPEDVQRALGSVPSGFLAYFEARFPSLLMWAYRVMACFCLERLGDSSSVCPLEEIEEDERRGRAVPSMAVPLKDWDGLVLTTQFRAYYEHVSIKRLLQLQEEARMRYRVWSNDEDAWVKDDVNRNCAAAPSGRVRLVKGWGEKVARWAAESERRVKDEAKEERAQQQRERLDRDRDDDRGRDRERDREREKVVSAGHAVPSISMFPPLSSLHSPARSSTGPSTASQGLGSGRVSPVFNVALSTSPGKSPSLLPSSTALPMSPPPVTTRASPPPAPAAGGTGWDNVAKSWTTALLTPAPAPAPAHPPAAAVPVVAVVGGPTASSGMVRLAKRPGIKTLAPFKATEPSASKDAPPPPPP